MLRDALGAVVPMFDRTVSFGAKFYPQVINPIDQGNIDALNEVGVKASKEHFDTSLLAEI